MTTPIPPKISVITPTWQRHDLLFSRCIPSVQAQTYPDVEHVIVSDGPDPKLLFKVASLYPALHIPALQYAQLPEHDPDEHWGAAARLFGAEFSSGDLITYCDDDDALRPDHCALMAAALLSDPEAGFAVSRMATHGGAHSTVIGHGPLACGNVGSPMIMHRRETLDYGTWDSSSWIEDWELVQQWLEAGIKYANVDAETCDVWPSGYRGK